MNVNKLNYNNFYKIRFKKNFLCWILSIKKNKK